MSDTQQYLVGMRLLRPIEKVNQNFNNVFNHRPIISLTVEQSTLKNSYEENESQQKFYPVQFKDNQLGIYGNDGITSISVDGKMIANQGDADIISIPWSIIQNVPTATSTQSGIVKVAASRNNIINTISGGQTPNRYYGVEIDSGGKLFVNVPWTGGSGGADKYHISGNWNGLTYTAEPVNGAEPLQFTLQTGTTSTTVAAGNHTHTISLANDAGTSSLTLMYSGKYRLTAGGSSYVFTMPALGNTSTTAAAGNHTHSISLTSSSGTSTITLSPNTTYQLTAGGQSIIFKTSVLADVATSGNYDDLTNKPTIPPMVVANDTSGTSQGTLSALKIGDNYYTVPGGTGGAVTKVSGGNSLSVTPSTGIGDVTVSLDSHINVLKITPNTTYSLTAYYREGDVVLYSGQYYKCKGIVTGTGNGPSGTSASNTYWEYAGGGGGSGYISTTLYKAGDIVYAGSYKYICTGIVVGRTPTNTTYWESATASQVTIDAGILQATGAIHFGSNSTDLQTVLDSKSTITNINNSSGTTLNSLTINGTGYTISGSSEIVIDTAQYSTMGAIYIAAGGSGGTIKPIIIKDNTTYYRGSLHPLSIEGPLDGANTTYTMEVDEECSSNRYYNGTNTDYAKGNTPFSTFLLHYAANYQPQNNNLDTISGYYADASKDGLLKVVDGTVGLDTTEYQIKYGAQVHNTVLAGPAGTSSSDNIPTFRNLVPEDFGDYSPIPTSYATVDMVNSGAGYISDEYSQNRIFKQLPILMPVPSSLTEYYLINFSRIVYNSLTPGVQYYIYNNTYINSGNAILTQLNFNGTLDEDNHLWFGITTKTLS